MRSSSIKILKSKIRASILNLFFNHPENEYYLRQIENLTGYSVGNVRREMTVLESDGLFLSRNIGKIKLFKLNKAYPLYNEVKSIIRKTIGIEGGLKNMLSHLKNVDFAFIYGSFAEGREKTLSDVDVIVIGDVKASEVKSLLFEYQSKTGREINSIIYTKKEFLNKIKIKNHFVTALLGKKKIFVKGKENELEDLYKFGKLQKHKTSPQEIKDLFGVAERCIKDSSQTSISLDLRFISAYQAALAAGEALLCCLGYTAPKGNYHYMVWEALKHALDEPFKNTLILFNDARSKRSDAFYDRASVTSDTEYKEVFEEAKKFVAFVRAKIKKDSPELGKSI